jgi:hypothetical protein
MAVSCVLYVRTAQYIFSSVILPSAYTVYHTATYQPFLQTNGTFCTSKKEKTGKIPVLSYIAIVT